MLMHGRRDIADVGRYRTLEDAMQIVSGALHARRVHFEAPPSDTVPMEVSRFVAWFNNNAPSSPSPLPAITRAAISHLLFGSIYPFEDGNGGIEVEYAVDERRPAGCWIPDNMGRSKGLLIEEAVYGHAAKRCRLDKVNGVAEWKIGYAAARASHALAGTSNPSGDSKSR